MLNKEQKRMCRYLCLQTIYAYEVAGEQDICMYSIDNIKDKIVDFKEELAEKVATGATTGETGKLPLDFFIYPRANNSYRK